MQTLSSYEEAVARKYPEQVVVAIARDAHGKCNPIALGWTMFCSSVPPLVAISVNRGHYSTPTIRYARAFVLAFPSEAQAEDVAYFGAVSGRDADKLAVRGTATQPATRIDCVLLADAVLNLECVVQNEVLAGDHVIFVGRVVAAHTNDDSAARRLYSLGGGALGGAG
ncbi:MAG: flavin reductase family protein [Chloroflexi bacterium]|nr:flavin reductase family protein [Chloroflexota bacterium]